MWVGADLPPLVGFLSTPRLVSSFTVNEVVEILIAMAGSGAAGTLVTQYLGRRKLSAEGEELRAEAVDVLTKASERVIAQLEGEIERLVREVDIARAEVTTLRREVVILRGLLQDNGIDPYPD